jgi:anthranilate phosphoribosyltransferase
MGLKEGMDSIAAQIRHGTELSREQCASVVNWLADDSVPSQPKEEALEAMRFRGETAAEIAGFALALLDRAHDPGICLKNLPGPAVDVCGTGGDRLELFNISTTAMFVLAAGGAVVIKHGNRAITSQCGGADVLEELGVAIECDSQKLRTCVERVGLGFIFAPAYHPAFRAIGPVRKSLAARGVPTIFNLLGPLLNPARPPFQLVGVYSPALLPKYAEALRILGRRRAWAVHGSGSDELTCAGVSEVQDVEGEKITLRNIDPSGLGMSSAPVSALRGGGRAENARVLLEILGGEDTGPRADAVLLNAAAGFVVTGLEGDLGAGLERARRAVRDGKAMDKLRSLLEFSN